MIPIQENNVTPLMKQYFAFKQQHPDALMFFQVGDFYELFFEDAKIASAFLSITLTKRGKISGEPIPLCGVPVHALDHYAAKLVRGGFKVVICNQLEPATPGKVVERGVAHVLTPGTLTDTTLLDEKSASYLFSFFPGQESWGLLFGELLTAQMVATVIPAQADRLVESELIRFFPDEIIVPQSPQGKHFQTYFKKLGYYASCTDLPEQALKGLDVWTRANLTVDAVKLLEEKEAVRQAFSYFYAYLCKNQEKSLAQFKTIQFYQPEDFLILDAATQKNLELIGGKNTQVKNTLFALLDKAVTPMGSRAVKKWVMRPLVEPEAIEQRHDVVALFCEQPSHMQSLRTHMTGFGDIERIVGRIMLGRSSFHDYIVLRNTLEKIPHIQHALMRLDAPWLLRMIMLHIKDFSALHQELLAALNDDEQKEWRIKAGYDGELDRLRALVDFAQQNIVALEEKEQKATGISSLKIRYSQAFGYSIEITKTHYNSVPAHYIRQQTLVGRERFVTPELQQLQFEMLHARSSIETVEKDVFSQVQAKVVAQGSALRKLAQSLAHLDALVGFAHIATDNNYVRPSFNGERNICITQGRHPIVEQHVNRFIANDTALTNQESLWLITGPNMGGKSTYLRQVALMCIMAQCGSFVSAQKADLSIIDRIFTRIGAGDNVAEGKSTFLVEMEETAIICTQATEHSLVILDEVGRGTSTFDGIAIAQAVVEYIFTHVRARCLFATHYHELTALSEQMPGVVCYHTASMRTKDGIVFLHKMIKGTADGSFGIEVAKLAALPTTIIARAHEILENMHAPSAAHTVSYQVQPAEKTSQYIAEIERLKIQMIELQKKMQKIEALDWEHVTPKRALDILWELKNI